MNANNRRNLFSAPDLRGFGRFVSGLASRIGGLRLIEFTSRATLALMTLLRGPRKQEAYQILGPYSPYGKHPYHFIHGTPRKLRRGKDRKTSPQGSPFETVTIHMLRRAVNKGFKQGA